MKTSTSLLALAITTTLSLGAHAASYKVAEVADGGTITGKVTFSGDDPAPTAYAITKDNEVCGTGERLVDYVKVNDGALTNVVVYLDKVKEGKDFDASVASGTLDQRGCEFDPFMQVIKNGAELEAINDDPVLHNIHTYEIIGRAKKTVFNVSQPKQGDTYTKAIKLKRGVAMKIECDAHDFMHGFVYVAKNPYYAVVDDSGSFTIDNVPPGKYTIKAWHGTLGEKKGKVTVAGGESAAMDFEYK